MPQPNVAICELTPAEELLLRAATTESQAAQQLLAAWKRARGWHRYDEIDYGSMLLLPRVYRNLTRAGADDPWSPQLAALARYQWLKNSARLRQFAVALAGIQYADIRPLVTGGLALLAGGYLHDAAEYPELTAQLLIGAADGERTRLALQTLGWHCGLLPPVPGWRSESWRGPDGGQLHVEYQWLPKRYPVVGAAALMPHSEPAELDGLGVTIPSATELLVRLCLLVSIQRTQSAFHVVYLADAARVLQRGAQRIDWQRLLAQPPAVVQGVLPVLEYLSARLAAPVPAEWLAAARNQLLSAPAQRAAQNPWAKYVQAEQAAGRTASGLGALRFAAWRIAATLGRPRRKAA